MNPTENVDDLLSEGRVAFEQGNCEKSLILCQKAYKILPSLKLMRKIERIQDYIAEIEKENIVFKDSTCTNPNTAKELYESGKRNDSLVLLKNIYQYQPSENLHLQIDHLEQLLESDCITSLNENQCVESTENVRSLVEQARTLYQSGSFHECLVLLRRSQKIEFSDKIERKIERIEAFIQNPNKYHVSKPDNLSEVHVEQINETVMLDDQFHVPKALFEKLYSYQRDGVRWLWHLHNKGLGGILADDMGLGKTVQVIAFLSGLFVSFRESCTALVVMPVSVLLTWESELKKWAPVLRIFIFRDKSRIQRLRGLASIQRHGGIVLTTYGMLTSSSLDLATDINADPQFLQSKTPYQDTGIVKQFGWTYMILDEAHKIKNPAAKTTKAAHNILVKHYILLTGTAVQNNLKELWSLYHLTHRGRLLGTQKTFQLEYERPIIRSREKDASRAEKVHGQLMGQSLRKLIDPYFLRRMKSDVLTNICNPIPCYTSGDKQLDIGLPMQLPKKSELVVWIHLSDIQEKSYRSFLELDHIKELILGRNRRSPLVELLILKKMCDHPRLLSKEQCLNLNLEHNSPTSHGSTNHMSKFDFPSSKKLILESAKLLFLQILMTQFLVETQSDTVEYPPRTLIFSQSLKFLDMAECVILHINEQLPSNLKHRHRVLRLDGRVSKLDDRLRIIQKFEHDKTYTVMLLTTQVGGVGLTITSANRVIILDPNWNPATDAQAVDRVYRIGQRSDVIVYRLITCATVEEKIYRRQIFKDSVIRQTTSTGVKKTDLDPYRYFTRQDLFELFKLDNTHISVTQRQLEKLHDGSERWSDQNLNPHLKFLTGQSLDRIVFGLSFHDLMFSKESCHDDSNDDYAQEDHDREYVKNRLIAAERAIAKESAETDRGLPIQLAKINLNHKIDQYFGTNTNNLFKPSTVDSHRPMFNRPVLGNLERKSHEIRERDAIIVSDGESESSLDQDISDEDIVDVNPTSDPSHITVDLENSIAQMNISHIGTTFPTQSNNDQSSSDHHTENTNISIDKTFHTPTQYRRSSIFKQNPSYLYRSTPVPSKSVSSLHSSITQSPRIRSHDCDVGGHTINFQTYDHSFISDHKLNENVIHMDISIAMDDYELANTVEMKSLHEILDKSSLLQASNEDSVSEVQNEYIANGNESNSSKQWDAENESGCESSIESSEDSVKLCTTDDEKYIDSVSFEGVIEESDLIEPSIE